MHHAHHTRPEATELSSLLWQGLEFSELPSSLQNGNVTHSAEYVALSGESSDGIVWLHYFTVISASLPPRAERLVSLPTHCCSDPTPQALGLQIRVTALPLLFGQRVCSVRQLASTNIPVAGSASLVRGWSLRAAAPGDPQQPPLGLPPSLAKLSLWAEPTPPLPP